MEGCMRGCVIRYFPPRTSAAAFRLFSAIFAWGDNSRSAKGPGHQNQGVPGGFSVRFSESGEGPRGPEGGAKGSCGTPGTP
jgi:hypothetical protein